MTLLSILVPQLPQRDSTELIKNLHEQAKGYNVEVLTMKDHTKSGIKRRCLTLQANGEYICFVDDDDIVAPDYVSSIVKGLTSKPDLLTFNIEMTNVNRLEKWDMSGEEDNRKQGIMTSNHLCVWKTCLAQLVPWCSSLGPADDLLWYEPLHRFIKLMGMQLSKVHLNTTLYYYQYNSLTTQNQKASAIADAKEYFGRGLRIFNHNGKVAIEDGCQSRMRRGNALLKVFNSDYRNYEVPISELEQYHVIHPWFCRQ